MYPIVNLLGATPSHRTEAYPNIGQGKPCSFFFVLHHQQDENGCLEDWSKSKSLSDHRQYGQRYGVHYLQSKKTKPEPNGSRRNLNLKKLKRHEDSNMYLQNMKIRQNYQ